MRETESERQRRAAESRRDLRVKLLQDALALEGTVPVFSQKLVAWGTSPQAQPETLELK